MMAGTAASTLGQEVTLETADTHVRAISCGLATDCEYREDHLHCYFVVGG